MAKVRGLISISGKLGGYQFYSLNGKDVVRMAADIPKENFKTLPNYKNFRANGSEFGHCSQTGKALRNSLQPLLQPLDDKTLHYKVTALLTAIKNCDASAAHGKRTVYGGLCTDTGKELLRGFRFRPRYALGQLIRVAVEADLITGSICREAFVPGEQLSLPKGVTTAVLRTALVVLGSEGSMTATFSEPRLINADDKPGRLFLAAEPNANSGIRMLFVSYGYGMYVNGAFCELVKRKWGIDVVGVW